MHSAISQRIFYSTSRFFSSVPTGLGGVLVSIYRLNLLSFLRQFRL